MKILEIQTTIREKGKVSLTTSRNYTLQDGVVPNNMQVILQDMVDILLETKMKKDEIQETGEVCTECDGKIVRIAEGYHYCEDCKRTI